MKKHRIIKILIFIVIILFVSCGIIYAVTKLYQKTDNNSKISAIFSDLKMEKNKNTIWINTFQLAWNELSEYLVNGKNIEFEGENSLLVDKLNMKKFTKDMINEEDYYIKIGKTTKELQKTILNDIKNKFDYNADSILNDVNFDSAISNNRITVYAMLNKKFTFLKPFVNLEPKSFKNSEKQYFYFGIQEGATDELDKNLDVLFYNNENEFAINLKTKENEEIILYRTNNNDNFESLYNQVLENTNKYNDSSLFRKNDCLEIPQINVKYNIRYDELCGKMIKGTEWEISNAIQNVTFNMNYAGGNLKSEGMANLLSESISQDLKKSRKFIFNDTFVIFMKEKGSGKLPYMSLYVDNSEILNEYSNNNL